MRKGKCTIATIHNTYDPTTGMGMWPVAASRNGNGNGKGTAAKQEAGVKGIGMVFMVVLALQFGLQPLLQKLCVDYDRVDRVSLVITTEVTKIFLCAFVIVSSGPNVYRCEPYQ